MEPEGSLLQIQVPAICPYPPSVSRSATVHSHTRDAEQQTSCMAPHQHQSAILLLPNSSTVTRCHYRSFPPPFPPHMRRNGHDRQAAQYSVAAPSTTVIPNLGYAYP